MKVCKIFCQYYGFKWWFWPNRPW